MWAVLGLLSCTYPGACVCPKVLLSYALFVYSVVSHDLLLPGVEILCIIRMYLLIVNDAVTSGNVLHIESLFIYPSVTRSPRACAYLSAHSSFKAEVGCSASLASSVSHLPARRELHGVTLYE